MKIGILGGGQLAYMLGENIDKNIFNNIEKIYIFSDKFDIPSNLLKDIDKIDIIYGEYNLENIIKFSEKCDIITYEFENIDINLLKEVETPIYPDIKYLEIIQDKYEQKKYLYENNLEIGPFGKIESEESIYTFIKRYNYPIVLKARRGSFDGRGNIIIKKEEDLLEWLNNTEQITNYYMESFIKFDNEISICGYKEKGEIKYFEPVKNEHKKSILLKTEYKKDLISEKIIKKIKKICKNVMNIFNTKGVLCIEMFHVGDEIYINEIALRVHNTYHISLDCCNISQFEVHIKSILDMDIIEPKFIYEGVMYNLISNMQMECNLIDELNRYDTEQIKTKKYNKKEIGVRKVGHINIKY